jgi:hypothetical protein
MGQAAGPGFASLGGGVPFLGLATGQDWLALEQNLAGDEADFLDKNTPV